MSEFQRPRPSRYFFNFRLSHNTFKNMQINMGRKILLWGMPLAIALAAGNLNAADYFVSQKSGSDKNPGTREAPFKTIQAAADIARPGDVVTVFEGVYREMVNPKFGGESNTRRIVYRAAEGEKVQIKGSEVVSGWERQPNGLWKKEIPDEFFGGHNPFKTVLEGDWFDPMGRVHHTGDVYLNGKSLYEQPDIQKVLNTREGGNPADPEGSALRWFCEPGENSTVIYANFGDADPNRELVEVSARFSCFYPAEEGINYLTVSGFDFSQAATQWGAPTARQVGMVSTNWNKGWIIENNKIHDTKCSGITLGKEGATGDNTWMKNPKKDGSVAYIEVTFKTLEKGWSRDKIGSHIVRGNEIYNCEQTGMCGSQGAAFSIIENNYIHDIWTKRQFSGAEIGGIKFHAPIDTLIRGNRIQNCGRGIWLDWMTQGSRVTQNLLCENTTDDIHVEVNHGPFVIDNNICLSRIGIYVFSGGGAYVNNMLSGMMRHFFDGRYTPYHFAHSTRIKGISTCLDDNQYYNNLFATTNPQNEQPNLETYGLHYLNGKKGPFADGNAYLGKSRPWNMEKNFFHKPDFDAGVRLSEEGGAVYLSFNLPEDFGGCAANTVSTGMFSVPMVSEEPFEDAEGREIVFDEDYFGARRKSSAIPGPIDSAKPGANRIKVWPRN